MNIGIIGPGMIATAISKTIKKLNNENIRLYACASRSAKKAEAFAKKFSFEISYGDYRTMLADNKVDLVYVATPHAFHYDMARAAIMAGKNVIVEKPITTDAKKLEGLIALAKEKGVFLTEAFWTAFDPLVKIIKDRIDSGVYGNILSVKSSFGQPLKHVRRLTDISLAGGALLDLGIYCVFHSVFFGRSPIENVSAESIPYETGVDMTTTAELGSEDYKASFRCSFATFYKNNVVIETEKAIITFDNINFPKKVCIKDKSTGKKTVEKIKCITGYEYEFIAAEKCLQTGKPETDEIPLAISLNMLEICDEIRHQIGLVYPFD